MKVTYRPAQPQDANKLAEISILAGGGTFELLLANMKRGIDPKAAMTALASAPDTEYSYNYYRVAEVNGQIAGGINLLSKEERYKTAPNINPILRDQLDFGIPQLVKFYFRARHLKGMDILSVPPKSLHINDIGVFPEYQGLGIGKELIKYSIQKAIDDGHPYLTLYVWADNEAAIGFYRKLGFELIKTAKVKPHKKYLPHSASHLMWIDLSSREKLAQLPL